MFIVCCVLLQENKAGSAVIIVSGETHQQVFTTLEVVFVEYKYDVVHLQLQNHLTSVR